MKTSDLLRKQYEQKTRTVQPIFLELAAVAEALSISVSTVQALVRKGELPGPRKISGNRVGWLWREVVEWAENCPLSDIPPPPNTGAKKPRSAKQAPQDAQIAA